MRRKLWIGLLLTTTIALAEARAQTEAAQPQVEEKQEQMKAAQPQAEESRGQTETARETSEASLEKSGEVETESRQDAKVISGMSILGNQEAPKSLVIVPWKSSEIGKAMDISTMLDDSRQPVDREVFLRALRYYEIRSEKKP
jgi:hypothetical protein